MNETYKWPLIAGAVIIAAIFAYSLATMPDTRSTTEKVGDAIHELPKGADKAERQLEDRTPGQRLGDAVKDAGDNIKEKSNP